jgi:hypothetical protein
MEGEAMTHKVHAADPTAPLKPIRLFDVFAEMNRLKALGEGRPEDEAKGYGIWLAKVVASRRYGQKTDGEGRAEGKPDQDRGPRRSQVEGFKAVGGELQTDETFDSEIVDRMGGRFYDAVFAPAIKAAVESGQKYEDIRDSIRADWKARR